MKKSKMKAVNYIGEKEDSFFESLYVRDASDFCTFLSKLQL